MCPHDLPPHPPVDVPPTASILKELVYNAGTVCPLCRTRHPFAECLKCLGGGYVITHAPDEAKTALTENHRFYGPMAMANTASAIATEVRAQVTAYIAATAEFLAQRDKSLILSNERGLADAGGIFSKQKCEK